MSVPNRFAHSDNVRYKVFPLQLEGPEISAYPSKANLNLISNKDAPSLSHMSVERRIVLYKRTNTEKNKLHPERLVYLFCKEILS